MNSMQKAVMDWMLVCFGEQIAADKVERNYRNYRFLEEALELVQSLGCPQEDAHKLVDYVYNRPQGDINQECGGVVVTLTALCNANGIDFWDAGEKEVFRI